MDVDHVVEREALVEEGLDALHAVALHQPPDGGAVVRHAVHHLAVGVLEPGVVLEEVAVPVDVRHDQLLVDQRVRLHQVGVAGIVVDHQLVDLLQPVRVALRELLVLHAEAPVRVARGKPPNAATSFS
jgi:hypothetical protein